MIEKLEPIKEFDCSDTPQAKMQHHSYHNDCIKKINELVDAVNELQTRAENVQKDTESRPGNVQDPYAKYRKLAGKLCRFWDKDKDSAIYDILEEVIADWSYKFKTKRDYIFDHCEPVKPDDNIIYKGGDNE